VVTRSRPNPRIPARNRNPHHELVLSHKHPDDYRQIAATLQDIRHSHRPLSSRHRIITVQDATRDVVVIGERLYDNTGEVIGTQGFYIDVTQNDKARQAEITDAVAQIAENRAIIEQAKGVLMYVYRIDAGAAFDLLTWRSQETNTKLRVLAEQLLEDVRALTADDALARDTFDRLLLTIHQRLRSKAAEQPRGSRGFELCDGGGTGDSPGSDPSPRDNYRRNGQGLSDVWAGRTQRRGGHVPPPHNG
jgi:hypothetical protein